jgi:hypothetical protein
MDASIWRAEPKKVREVSLCVGGGVKMLLARRFENVAHGGAADAKTATGF